MKQLTLLAVLATLLGCGQALPENNTTAAVNVDSLTAMFTAGWNNKDSAAIMQTMAEDCLVMNDSLMHKGRSAIAKDWVSGGVKVLSNIKTSSAKKDSDNRIAYDAGTYSVDLTPPGGPLLKERGNYNLTWTKQTDGNWKLTLVHIEDITRMPDIN